MGLLEKGYGPRDRPLEAGEARARDPFTFVRIAVVLVFVVLAVQLLNMQVLKGDSYRERAENNRLRALTISSDRGLIYDSNGTPLVSNSARYNAVVVPADLPEGEARAEVLRELETLLGVPAFEIRQRIEEIRRSDSPFASVMIKNDLTLEEARILKEASARMQGVELEIQPSRIYMGPASLGHIIGYIGPLSAEEYAQLARDGYAFNDVSGKTGLEAGFESVLRGQPGFQEAEVDAAGTVIERFREVDPVPGGSLVLTINSDLQRKVEEVLWNEDFRCGSDFGCSPTAAAVVMEVKTGKVLAMVSMPTFDVNLFSDSKNMDQIDAYLEDPAKPLINHVIADQNTPGSTFKIITATAGLEEGVITPETTIYTDGALEYKDALENIVPFNDWLQWGWGPLNVYGGIAVSSNQFFYTVAGGDVAQSVKDGLGPSRLAEWAWRFGLGQPTGIDLPGEALGTVPTPQWKEQTLEEPWWQGDTYYFGIGQGYTAASPLQMLLVAAGVANDGVQMRPQLVDHVLAADGEVIQGFEPEVLRSVGASPETIAVVQEGMRLSVNSELPVGVGAPAKVDGVTVAGKTGTAEFGKPNSYGKYLEHGWFVGYAPFEDPEVAIVVYYELGGGHATASPAAGAILDYYFHQIKGE
jgi:penicillin-binding protein 2